MEPYAEGVSKKCEHHHEADLLIVPSKCSIMSFSLNFWWQIERQNRHTLQSLGICRESTQYCQQSRNRIYQLQTTADGKLTLDQVCSISRCNSRVKPSIQPPFSPKDISYVGLFIEPIIYQSLVVVDHLQNKHLQSWEVLHSRKKMTVCVNMSFVMKKYIIKMRVFNVSKLYM